MTHAEASLTITLQVWGYWRAVVSQQQWDILRIQLAGLTQDQARQMITTHIPTVQQVTIEHLWFWLPTNPHQITLVPTYP
ncbi:hypothetical protein KSF_108890 [Reticulibacter mediterranei]|uniref:Uncharacterized protein n=1 Tax=Reticulibacter mediterranei TaxID=2778369 RepID=A0A8J3IU29_9CHLR|nr:hypothetical protein [Reticulibacter mediterranei]GHP00842.1 hypothetical protein KSF_108890 [Reticulibacter mediterranei]